ncbi:hypothetical protein SDC9_185653 [bioreactor metagenome]|uniref:Transposase IS4-like domain-containing protein n=1 Tax=bioreactor metagenome TaxID=1076179 RepID=A0A645HIV6_9ZZZZ
MQTAVDGGSHLIAEYEVTNHNTDQGLLKEVAESAKEVLETETLEVVADKGYESRKDILDCVMNGIVPNVALKYDKTERTYAIDYVENEISEEERNSTKPEDIQKCISAGVLPKCYDGHRGGVTDTVGIELLQPERGRHGDMSDGMHPD